jgi:hypothetical protein
VVGVIRLVQEIADLARAGKPGMPTTVAARDMLAAPAAPRMALAFGALAEADAAALKQPRELIREGVSEYFMYTVEGRDTIPNGWAKRMPSFKADGVSITSYYKFEKERWGDKVLRYYQFTNSVPAKLGKEPLPDGQVKAFRFVSDDRLYAFVGRTSVKYIPIGEFVELELGQDLEVSVKPLLVDWQKSDLNFDRDGNVRGWTTRETWDVEVQNSKDIAVVLDVRRTFPGDWTLTTQARYESVDAHKVKFVLPLAPRAKQKFTYQLVTRHGTNATR